MEDVPTPWTYPDAATRADLVDLYLNSFSLHMNPFDLILVARVDNQPVGLVHMSHVAAKTLAMKLLESVQGFEQKTETVILTEELARRLLAE